MKLVHDFPYTPYRGQSLGYFYPEFHRQCCTDEARAKHIGGRAHLLLVFVMNWCPGKSEEHGVGESFFDRSQHLAEHIAVRLIKDKDNPLFPDQLDIVGVQPAVRAR